MRGTALDDSLSRRQNLRVRHSVIWLETGKHTRAEGFYRRLGWTTAQNLGNGDIRLEKRLR